VFEDDIILVRDKCRAANKGVSFPNTSRWCCNQTWWRSFTLSFLCVI